MERKRVVVTGLGIISPLGLTAEETWEKIKVGTNGISELSIPGMETVNVHVAGQVKGFNAEDYIDRKEARRMDRVMHFAVAASQEAMRSASLEEGSFNPERMGVILGTGIAGIESIEEQVSRGYEQGFHRVSPFFVPLAISNIVAAQVSMANGLKAHSSSVNTACAAGTDAIGQAFRMIQYGEVDLMMAGGSEASITKMGVGGFAALRALSQSKDPDRASIPYDKERDGFVIGEGAGLLVLEEYEHAKARGAKILAEILGYGTTCDAYHVTAPDPEATQAVRCFELAIGDAGLEKEDIQYINTHGTSTPLNDETETKAIRMTFGEHADKLAISSTKSMCGHLLGASGGLEAAVCVLALRDGWIPPTIGHRVDDPACDLDIVPDVGRAADLTYVLSNSLGFGGHNACLAFGKYEGN